MCEECGEKGRVCGDCGGCEFCCCCLRIPREEEGRQVVPGIDHPLDVVQAIDRGGRFFLLFSRSQKRER